METFFYFLKLETMISKKIKIRETWLDFTIPGNSEDVNFNTMVCHVCGPRLMRIKKQMSLLSMLCSPAIQIYLKERTKSLRHKRIKFS